MEKKDARFKVRYVRDVVGRTGKGMLVRGCRGEAGYMAGFQIRKKEK